MPPSRRIIRRIKMNRKGQFIVIGAIIIAAFMFALILTMSQMNVQRQVLIPEPVDEVVLAVASDFERCFQVALASASKTYCATMDKSEAALKGEEVIKAWSMALLEAYKGYGMVIDLSVDSTAKGVVFDLICSEGYGRTRAYTTFGMDVEGYGLRGLALTMSTIVELEISKVNITNEGSDVTMVFNVSKRAKGMGVPVEVVKVNVTVDDKEINRDRVKLTRVGRGEYLIEFGLDGFDTVTVVLKAMTEDGVWVAAKRTLNITATPQGGNGGSPPSGSEDWRALYISPDEPTNIPPELEDIADFSLNITKPRCNSSLAPPLNPSPPHSNQSGVSVIPIPMTLSLANTKLINITLYARLTSQAHSGEVPLSVTLLYYNNGTFVEIGGGTVYPINSKTPLEYTISFKPRVNEIPEGSYLVLNIVRPTKGGGVIQVYFGPDYPSRIELLP